MVKLHTTLGTIALELEESSRGSHEDVPVEDVVIRKAEVV